MARRVPIEPQRLDAPLTSSATFVILTVNDTDDAVKTVRSALGGLSGLIKNVAFRDLNASFACTVGIGSNVWDRLTGLPRPSELHPFQTIRGNKYTAISTPGDLLFHMRSERRDLNFEFERQLTEQLSSSVKVVDSTVGFRYFDARDLLGFVDGTANPVGQAVDDSVMITDQDDSAGAGGSYIVTQKYLHDLSAWRSLSTEEQEKIIGRTKADNIELDDAAEGTQAAHKTLSTIVDEEGNEHDILRDNMPFGSPTEGVYGTYFIGYSRKIWVTEKMLRRMFVGEPEGMHDRILDYSKVVSGNVFFAPRAEVLDGFGD